MPLVYDPEYQRELNAITEKAKRTGRMNYWAHLALSAVALGVTLWVFPDSPSAVVAIAAICIIAVLNSAANAIHASLTVLVSTVEWIGRKELGEYESE